MLRGAELKTGNGRSCPRGFSAGGHSLAALCRVPPRRSPELPVLPWSPKHSSRCCQGVWGRQGKGWGAEPPWWPCSPGRCPLLVPPQCWWLLLARVSPGWALQGPGLAGLSRHLLAAERMLWTKPLQLFFCISRILILWGRPQSVQGEQPVLPSCCSPRPTPLLLFGCLVPALPKSHCTDPRAPSRAQALLELPLPLSSLVSQPSPCLQPRPCPVCAVLVVPGELLPSLLLVWPGWGCAEPGGAFGCPSPAPASMGWAGWECKPLVVPGGAEGEGGRRALFGCRAGILRAGITFYKKKVSAPRPWHWGWMSWLFVTVLKTLSD